MIAQFPHLAIWGSGDGDFPGWEQAATPLRAIMELIAQWLPMTVLTVLWVLFLIAVVQALRRKR